jgi:hypothetical protein
MNPKERYWNQIVALRAHTYYIAGNYERSDTIENVCQGVLAVLAVGSLGTWAVGCSRVQASTGFGQL